jgi:hypothetical protein
LLRVLLIRDSVMPAYPGEWRAGTLLHVLLTSPDISETVAVTAKPRITRRRDMHKRPFVKASDSKGSPLAYDFVQIVW